MSPQHAPEGFEQPGTNGPAVRASLGSVGAVTWPVSGWAIVPHIDAHGEPAADPSVRIVVMGVASSGKTTIARAIADRCDAVFLDADDFHPAANVAKMAAGQPLTDDDRWSWLVALREQLSAHERVVVACSALRRSYRDILRAAGGVGFVYLDLDEATATDRAEHRSGHFMGAEMVASQFATLERPTADEPDITTVDATADIETVIAAALEHEIRTIDPNP